MQSSRCAQKYEAKTIRIRTSMTKRSRCSAAHEGLSRNQQEAENYASIIVIVHPLPNKPVNMHNTKLLLLFIYFAKPTIH